MKKVLIIRTDIDEKKSSRSFTGVDSAITGELYDNYGSRFRITANHYYSKYTFMEGGYLGTFDTMDELLKKKSLGKVLVLTHEEWLDKMRPDWRDVSHYQYW